MAPFADGAPQAAQWPIPPGHFFDYEIATQAEDPGTYFYHSHVGMQAMSCFGPLIVDDCGSSPHQYDDERVFVFHDYFTETGHQMMDSVAKAPYKGVPETDGILLNGQGVSTGKTAKPGNPGRKFIFGGGYSSPRGLAPVFPPRLHPRSPGPLPTGDEEIEDGESQQQTSNTDDCILPVIDVDPGKTYRFRFIGGTGLSFLTMGFEGHSNLIVVQVDGSEYNVPVSTDRIQLGAGQRFDVMFTTKTEDELKADGDKKTYFLQFETRDRPNPYRGYGVLRYSSQADVPAAPENPVITLPTDVTDWLEYTLQPLYPDTSKAPTAAEVTRRIVVDCVQTQDEATGRVVWELAGLPWTEDSRTSPLLVDIYQHGEAAIPDYDAAINNNNWDPKTESFPVKLNEVLEIVFQNTGSRVRGSGFVESHPFHAHGQHYYDIGSGPGRYDADANNAKLEELDYKPVRRDTTMLYRYDDRVEAGQAAGWRAWRIRAEDPGVWMIHCHILAHMMMGK